MIEAALILGLASSLHCIGMCGPIALALPLNRKNFLTEITGLVSYNLGRIISYASLGLLFGGLGKGIYIFTQQQYLSIAAGVFMLFLAFLPRFFDSFSAKSRWYLRFQNA
jgi:sulfite exporter TauE/SafE